MGAVSGNRLSWMSVLAAHIVVAGLWWWLLPHGFAISHPRFWVNEVLPIAVILSAVGVTWMARRGQAAAAPLFLTCLGMICLTIGTVGRGLFPLSARGLFIVPSAWGIFVLAVAMGNQDGAPRAKPISTILAALIGIAIGTALVFTERAPLPSTHPANFALLDDD